MSDFLTSNEPIVRLSVFIVVLFILALWELKSPRRELKVSKSLRWLSNLGINLFNTVLLRGILLITGISMAFFTQENQWGLFHYIYLPQWVQIVIFIFLFDLTIYFQHRWFHKQAFLWRLHRMHHTDMDYDVTTGNRFHPVEIIISMIIKIALVAAVGPPIIAILIAEIILNTSAMFNHSNIRLPLGFDKILRLIVVTPDMHRIHHSTDPKEYNRNFGFNFPWWDRLFGSYVDQPNNGHEKMDIGIKGFQDKKSAQIQWMLIQPFSKAYKKQHIIDR